MISQGWKNQRRPDEEAPLQVKRAATQAQPRGHWVDSMLGQGSSRTVESAVGRFRRAGAGEPDAGTGAKKIMRLQALGSESEPLPGAKPKGYVRLGMAALALAVVLAKFKPWQAAASIHMPDLARPAGAETRAAAEAEPRTPLIDAGGTPVALWRSEAGQWHGVNAKAELSRMTEAEANSRLALPRIEGPSVHSLEKRGGHVLALAADGEQLAELLPLRADLAAEVDSILIHGKSVRLRTHGGAVADLGEAGFREKQQRLVSVLADIEARKKRAASVDLRFENSAVVRLASR